MTTATTYEEYTWVIDIDGWGDGVSVTDDEHEYACERAEEWLTDHEGDALSISVRPARHGEIAGVYQGDQILGYSVWCPGRVTELTNRAWAHALETWEAM